MSKTNNLFELPGLVKVTCNWEPEQPSSGSTDPNKHTTFSVVQVGQNIAASSAQDKPDPTRFRKGKGSFTVTFTFTKHIGRCQIFVNSNARVMEVYGLSSRSTVDRFLFSLDSRGRNSDSKSGLYEIVMAQPRAVPENTTILKLKLLSLYPDKKGPCDVGIVRLAVPSQVLGANAGRKSGTSSSRGRQSSRSTGGNGAGIGSNKRAPTSISDMALQVSLAAAAGVGVGVGMGSVAPQDTTSSGNGRSNRNGNGNGNGNGSGGVNSGTLGLLMQCESGISRRIMQKVEEALESRMKTLYGGIQSAVGRLDRRHQYV